MCFLFSIDSLPRSVSKETLSRGSSVMSCTAREVYVKLGAMHPYPMCPSEISEERILHLFEVMTRMDEAWKGNLSCSLSHTGTKEDPFIIQTRELPFVTLSKIFMFSRH